MAKSDFIFEDGDPIYVGGPVENDFVFAKNELVSDGDTSNLVFIRSRGLGENPGIESDALLTLYDGTSTADSKIVEWKLSIPETTPNVGDAVSIGFTSSDGSPEYDNIQIAEGTEIENFDDCNAVGDYFDSAYLGGTGSVPPSDDWEIAGSNDCYLVENQSSFFNAIHSSVGYGLENYPDWGDTILFEVGVDSGKDFGFGLGGDASDRKLQLSYNKGNDELSANGEWIDNDTKSFDSSNIPTKVILFEVKFNLRVIEDFFHNDLSNNYSGDTGDFSIVTSPVREGTSYTLRADGSTLAGNINTTGGSGVPKHLWPDSSDNISFYIMESVSGFTKTTFKKNGNVQLRVRTSGRDDFTQFDFMGESTQNNTTVPNDKWLLVNIEVTSDTNQNDTATMTMYDGDTTSDPVLDQISHSISSDRTGTYDELIFGDGDSSTYYSDLQVGLR